MSGCRMRGPCLLPKSMRLSSSHISVLRSHRHQHKARKPHVVRLSHSSGSQKVDPWVGQKYRYLNLPYIPEFSPKCEELRETLGLGLGEPWYLGTTFTGCLLPW